MEVVANIIDALGIDDTLKIQLIIFAFAFLFLKYVVFNPYFSAFEERQRRTTGSQEKANELIEKTKELEERYQKNARALNEEIKAIYDKARLEGSLEQEKIQAEARERARAMVEKARGVIEGEFNRARESLIKETPTLSKTIAERLLAEGGRQ